MKPIPLLMTLGCGCALSAPPMTASFDNGDAITGNLVDVKEDAIIWNSDFFVNPESLSLERLSDIRLPAGDAINLPEGDHVAVVTLTNDDVIRGSLVRLDEKEVCLMTSFAGQLVFRRDMVAELRIEERPEIYYAGPGSLEEWTHKKDDWSFENGKLVSRSTTSASREVGKHDQFRVAFDVEWRESARFRIVTCADDADLDEVDNCFELICQSNYAYMRKRTKRNGRSEAVTIGTTSGVREFQEREKVRVELLHDLTTGRIRFNLGDRVVADWREPAPGAGDLGGHIHFVSDSGVEIRVSRIRVSSWDGTIEGKWQENGLDPFGEEEELGEPEPEERPTGILLRNGDLIEGDTVGIDEGRVRLKSDLGEFELPVSRLRSFALRTDEEAADPELTWKPILRNGDIRAHFVEGDRITFQLIGFAGDSVRGRSQTFGEAEFSLSAFNRLEFNLYSDDSGFDW